MDAPVPRLPTPRGGRPLVGTAAVGFEQRSVGAKRGTATYDVHHRSRPGGARRGGATARAGAHRAPAVNVTGKTEPSTAREGQLLLQREGRTSRSPRHPTATRRGRTGRGTSQTQAAMRCLQMGADATCTTPAGNALLRRAMAAIHRGPGRPPIPTTELPHAQPPLECRPIRLGSRHRARGPQRPRRPQRPTHGRGHPRERQRGTEGKGQRRQRPHCRQRKGTKRQRAPKPYHSRHADAPAHTQADRGTPRGRFQEGRALPPSRRSAPRRVATAPTTRSAPRCPSLATGLRWRRTGRDGTSGR